MSQSNAAEVMTFESMDPGEILERMLLLSEQALASIGEGDAEPVQTALAEWDRLAQRAQPLLVRHYTGEPSSAEDGDPSSSASRDVRDLALRLQDVNERLTAAVEQRSLELARDLRLIDESPMVLDAYGKGDSGSRPKIDLFR